MVHLLCSGSRTELITEVYISFIEVTADGSNLLKSDCLGKWVEATLCIGGDESND